MAQGCGPNYMVYTDAGGMWNKKLARETTTKESQYGCFFPSIHGLENIAKYYPNSTILVISRKVDAWIKSAHVTWSRSIIQRMSSYCPGVPGYGKFTAREWAANNTLPDWYDFYNRHTESVRSFSQLHNLTYIEVALEDPNIAMILESKTGVSQECWGHHNNFTDKQASLARLRERRAKEGTPEGKGMGMGRRMRMMKKGKKIE
jgi:hypothetical protein